MVFEHYQDVVSGANFEVGSNPINKLALGVDCSDAELMLDVIFHQDENETHPPDIINRNSTEATANKTSKNQKYWVKYNI